MVFALGANLQALAEVTSRWAVPADASDLSVALPKVARRTGSFAGEVGRQERGVPALRTNISISTLAAVLGAQRTTSTHRATARQRVVADRADLPTLAIRIQKQVHLALGADLCRVTRIAGVVAPCADRANLSSDVGVERWRAQLLASTERCQGVEVSALRTFRP